MGSKWANNTSSSIPNGPQSILEICVFQPFLTHFWSENGPFSRHIFFAPGTLVDPPLAPTVRSPGCPPAPPSAHWYGGLGVSLGDSQAWKPQKLGGCGWTRYPRNSVLSHVAQDMAHSWFWGCSTQTTHIWAIFSHFWAVSLYHGVRRQQRALCHEEVKVHVECMTRFRSIGRFEWILGPFWAKKGCFWGLKKSNFGSAPPDLPPPPRGASGEFLAQNLDSARAPPRV